jgi:hypothetical protein
MHWRLLFSLILITLIGGTLFTIPWLIDGITTPTVEVAQPSTNRQTKGLPPNLSGPTRERREPRRHWRHHQVPPKTTKEKILKFVQFIGDLLSALVPIGTALISLFVFWKERKKRNSSSAKTGES